MEKKIIMKGLQDEINKTLVPGLFAIFDVDLNITYGLK